MRVSLAQAAQALQRKADAAIREVRRANEQASYEALLEARKLSSGPFSSRALRAMGHPYARRRPRPPLPAHVINVQSGRFRRAWRIAGHGDALRLVNDTPYGRGFARGTARMIARPISIALAARIREKRMARLKEAARQGLAR